MSSLPQAVFLSYAREDTDAARRIADALRVFGVEVWFDQKELRGGDAWDAKIRDQIRGCALFIPIISATTESRREGYFRREWKAAADRTADMGKRATFLLPIVIDETSESHADVPDEFLRVQWTRLSHGVPSAQFVEQVRSLIESPRKPAIPGSGSREAFAAGETLTRSATVRPRRLWGAMLAVALLAAGVVLWRSRPSSGTGGLPAVASGEGRVSPVISDHGRDARATPAATAAAQSPLDFANAKSKSIAVLPFVNLGADKADEYLGDGITEELLNALCQIKGLRVPGRSSCFAFKGKAGDDIFRQVGEKLRVSTVLEGSVRKAGDKIRITAQLINVADGFHLWSQTYDGDMKDILAVQAEVAQRVVQALQLQLGGDEVRALAKKPTKNVEAHRLYLLGRFHFAKGTTAGWAEAMRCFNQAIELDPRFALAYCGLADAYGWIPLDEMPGRIAWAKEREMAEKALALDPELADAHLSLGIALADSFDWNGGEKAIRRALELNPNLALAFDQQAWILAVFGRFDEAIAKQKRAIELDPLSPLINRSLAVWLFFARRYDEAMAQARRTLELHPESASAQRLLGRCLLFKGQAADAIAHLEKARMLESLPRTEAFLGYAYAISGDRAKAAQILRDLEETAKRRHVSPGAFVILHLGLGQTDRALDWLEKGYELQDGICWDLKIEPMLDPIRHEPRFQALLKKVGLDK